MRNIVTVALAAALSVCVLAGPAAAAPKFMFLKTGVTLDKVLADDADCRKKAEATPFSPDPVIFTPNLYGALAAGAVSGFAAGYHRAHVQQIVADACMRDLGYARIEFTPEERADIDKLQGVEAYKAWAATFVAKDWSTRIEAAAKPLVPPLPAYVAEPMEVEGVRIHPADLKLVSADASSDGIILSGKADHARTAMLTKSMGGADDQRAKAMVGAAFYQLDYRPAPLSGVGEDASGVWCGPYRKGEPGKPDLPASICFWSLFDGYEAEMAFAGPPWLKRSSDLEARPFKAPAKITEIALTPSDTDLIGPMDFALVFDRFVDDGADLYATATRDGKLVIFWRGHVKLDKTGRGELPFWTHRLVLTRSSPRAAMVHAEFLADGDGRGWSSIVSTKPSLWNAIKAAY